MTIDTIMLPQDWWISTENSVDFTLYNAEGEAVVIHYNPDIFDILVLDAIKDASISP